MDAANFGNVKETGQGRSVRELDARVAAGMLSEQGFEEAERLIDNKLSKQNAITTTHAWNQAAFDR